MENIFRVFGREGVKGIFKFAGRGRGFEAFVRSFYFLNEINFDLNFSRGGGPPRHPSRSVHDEEINIPTTSYSNFCLKLCTQGMNKKKKKNHEYMLCCDAKVSTKDEHLTRLPRPNL